jgi:hypothetical protein
MEPRRSAPLPEQEQKELFMRGCEKQYSPHCERLMVYGAIGWLFPSDRAASRGIRLLVFLGLATLPGCASIRSRFGMEQDPPAAATGVASTPASTKPSQPAPILQTSGSDRAEIPVLPIEVPRGPASKGVGTDSISQTLPPTMDTPRDGSPKPPAFPAAGAVPAKLPAAFNLSNETAPKAALPGGQGQALGFPTRENSAERLAELSRAALARYQSIDSYVARFRRREVVGSTAKPEEMMVIKFRKNPWSVYFKWLGAEGHGREAAFVDGKYDNKLHTLLAAGDMPLMPAGKRFSLSPDNALVRNSSRHPIREAGFGTLVDQFARLVAANAKGDFHPGALRYLGPIKRNEFEQPCEAVEQSIPPGAEAGLPKGGRRLWVFDSATSLPVLMTAFDDANKEVEYYCYDRLQYPASLTDDDFNPDVLWRSKQ